MYYIVVILDYLICYNIIYFKKESNNGKKALFSVYKNYIFCINIFQDNKNLLFL